MDCGFFGITQKRCLDKGCCWGPTDNGPWCYSKNDVLTATVSATSAVTSTASSTTTSSTCPTEIPLSNRVNDNRE